jgi:AraC-like DNA-binding protein
MDETLRSNLLHAVAHAMRRPSHEILVRDVTVEDSSGLRRRVRIVVRPLLHAPVNDSANGSSHGAARSGAGSRLKLNDAVEGPRVLCCFTPPLIDWMRLRAEDLMANTEMMRLVPSIEFMTREVADQPGLNAIAESANLSPFHFHRRFTELFGITPKHMLLTTQIAHARRLLARDDHRLAEIARVCGFAHQSHFTSRFKQATGLTPTRWCRLLANKPGTD